MRTIITNHKGTILAELEGVLYDPPKGRLSRDGKQYKIVDLSDHMVEEGSGREGMVQVTIHREIVMKKVKN